MITTDPISRKTVLFHSSPDASTYTLETRQDVEPVLDMAQQARAEAATNWRGDWHRVASIPLVIWMKLRESGITRDPVALRRWLNDRDNRAFRTREGQV